MEKFIMVTLQSNLESEKDIEEKIPLLSILSVEEVWDHKGHYLGTHIGSKNHGGWMVKDRAAAVEKKMKAVGTRCYNYECPPSCCTKGGMYTDRKDKNKKGKKRAA
jgi:hypothetical protein